VESEIFEVVRDQQYRLNGSSIYVLVRKKSGRVVGRVQDKKGEPVANAQIHIAGFKTSSDPLSGFEFSIPGDRLEPESELTVVAPGYAMKRYTVTPNSNPVIVVLDRPR
jgi:hypothetical protein